MNIDPKSETQKPEWTYAYCPFELRLMHDGRVVAKIFSNGDNDQAAKDFEMLTEQLNKYAMLTKINEELVRLFGNYDKGYETDATLIKKIRKQVEP